MLHASLAFRVVCRFSQFDIKQISVCVLETVSAPLCVRFSCADGEVDTAPKPRPGSASCGELIAKGAAGPRGTPHPQGVGLPVSPGPAQTCSPLASVWSATGMRTRQVLDMHRTDLTNFTAAAKTQSLQKCLAGPHLGVHGPSPSCSALGLPALACQEHLQELILSTNTCNYQKLES